MSTMAPLARQNGIAASTVGDEVVLYDAERQHYHSLNATATAIWGACDGRRDAARIARDLGLPRDVVVLALTDLAELGLLEQRDATRIERRALLARIGAAGAGAIVLPVIASISAPSAQASGSQPCTDPCIPGCITYNPCNFGCPTYDTCLCNPLSCNPCLGNPCLPGCPNANACFCNPCNPTCDGIYDPCTCNFCNAGCPGADTCACKPCEPTCIGDYDPCTCDPASCAG